MTLPTKLPAYGERVPQELAARLTRSSVKLWRQPAGYRPSAYPWCDGNVIELDGRIVVSSAAHCFDFDYDHEDRVAYPIQDALRGTRGAASAVEISHQIHSTYSIHAHGDTVGSAPLATIDRVAESAGLDHSELVLLRPRTVTPQLRSMAIHAEFGAITPGEEVFFVGEPYSATGAAQVGARVLTYVGLSHQFERNEALQNAIIPHDLAGPTGPGANGGAGISARGFLTGPLRGVLVSEASGGDSREPADVEQEARADEGQQVGVALADDYDVVEFGMVDPAALAAELAVVRP